MSRRVRTWLRRYGPAELVAIVGAIAGYALVDCFTSSGAAAAYGAAVGDNLAYYGLLLAREARTRGLLAALPAFVVEFGPAEVLDTALVRPACIALAVHAFGPVGVVVAKLVADLVFYVPVIITYEATRRQRGGPERSTIVVSVSAAPTRFRSVRRKASSSAVSRQATRS
jgi:hypothetical protein